MKNFDLTDEVQLQSCINEMRRQYRRGDISKVFFFGSPEDEKLQKMAEEIILRELPPPSRIR